MIELHDELVTALKGRYEIERELGHGGMAVVYLANDLKHPRKVALKVMRPELADALGTERFLQEIAIAAPLVHPNIIWLHDSGEASGFLYYTMPYVEGETLGQRLSREVQLPITDAISIARQVASALDYAHTHGAVHRDIKPDNILLQGDHVFVTDFGLARAITKAASKPITTPGIVLGTAPYMSPEQCDPDGKVNPPSDIYSLGCVIFEMIAGVTPFRAATLDMMMTHHQLTDPPSLCAERRSCPIHLDAAVRRALAKSPADRFRSAGEFVRALESPTPSPTLLPPAPTPSWPKWLAIAATAVVVLVLSATFAIKTSRGGDGSTATAPDTMRVALLPLERAGVGTGPEDELLYEAFARWQDLVLVDPFQITDAVNRLGRVSSDGDARDIASTLGAGRYVRGRLSQIGDSLSLRLGLYDLRRKEPILVASTRVAVDGKGAIVAYHRLADTLLLRGLPGDGPLTGGEHRSLTAVQAFALAQRALDEWDLPKADSALEAATSFEPDYARAHLWLAQIRAWRRLPVSSWREAARRAAGSGSDLGAHDQRLARALVLLGDSDFNGACSAYDELRRENQRDFAAWYGLGQCRTLDRLVIPEVSSPSGWRFRSSYRAGLAAYERAFELLPSAHRGLHGQAFKPLRTLLITDRDVLTAGYSAAPDSARFLARLAWMNDTIALIPYPWAQITGGAALYPPGFDRALAHQREAFRRIATAWSVALPRSPSAKEALAISLEMLGDPAAADTLRVARQLVTERDRRVQLAALEALMRVKFALPDRTRELRIARALADSLLEGDSTLSPATADQLSALAALLGRCDLAIDLARQAAEGRSVPVQITRDYAADAAEIAVQGTLGCPSREKALTIASVAERMRRDPVFASAATRRMAEDILLVGPAQLSLPWDMPGIASLAPSRAGVLVGAIHSAMRGDTAVARKTLVAITAAHGSVPPWIDAAYPEARLWVTLGDSARALDLLRKALDAVRTYEPRSLTGPYRGSSLVRAMALRAQLENAIGDRTMARAWSSAVLELWSGAADALQPVVRRMQSYTRS